MQTRKYRKSTISDVASAAGVSVSTVSAYIRGRVTVCSEETAGRINKAINEYHYIAAPAVRGSRDRSTNTIGSTLRDPTSYETIADVMFHFRLRMGVHAVMQERGLALLTYPRVPEETMDYRRIIDGRVDGVLFAADIPDVRPEMIAMAGLPIVVFGRYAGIPEGCGAARASERDVVNLALDHLVALGHKRIAHVSGPTVSNPFNDVVSHQSHEFAVWRQRFYEEYLTERMIYDPQLVAHSRAWSLCDNEASRIVNGWTRLQSPPTAVFCANDRLAFAIMKAAPSFGLRIPEDLSVVGVDNEPSSEAAGLTTVDVPLESVGRAGMLALLDLMDGLPAVECRPTIAVKDIVVRRSTAPLSESPV